MLSETVMKIVNLKLKLEFIAIHRCLCITHCYCEMINADVYFQVLKFVLLNCNFYPLITSLYRQRRSRAWDIMTRGLCA